MAPLCESRHHITSSDGDQADQTKVEVVTCRWCGAVLSRRSSLWPKNTSTYHRPPLSIRSDILHEHSRVHHRSGDVDNSDNSGDNTTVVIGSVVGVVLLVIALGLVVCCCMASRRSACRKKEKKKKKKGGKDKDKEKKKKKKKDKEKKDEHGQPSGTYQVVQEWLNHGGYGVPGVPMAPPNVHYGGLGGMRGQPGMGGEMDAPQHGYDAWAYN